MGADTSHYITRAEVAFRLAKIYGSASYDGSLKYLVMLRDPVRRAISSWEYKIASKCRGVFRFLALKTLEHLCCVGWCDVRVPFEGDAKAGGDLS